VISVIAFRKNKNVRERRIDDLVNPVLMCILAVGRSH